MPSRQAEQFEALLEATRARFTDPSLDLATVRDVVEGLHVAAAEPEGVTYAEVDAGGVPAIWCVPENADDRRVLLHNHLGGSVVASMHSDRKVAGHIAKAAGVRALVLDFRRAPEHKYPAQIDDVEAAYRWLLSRGHRPEEIASVGHSIGGYLAIALAIRLRDAGDPLPGAVLAISPWCDPSMSNATIESNAQTDKLLAKPLLEFFRESWLGGTGIPFDDPRINLNNADLRNLPPTCVYHGSFELLAGEAVDFVELATKQGAAVEGHVLEEGQHSFVLAAGRVPEVDAAIRDMGAWLRGTLG
jgi:acetyl esterase/lipase